MNHYVSEALRRLVRTRAENLCEYCLIDSADTFFGGEVDHIVSVKHGGATEAENLAYTCQPCNRNKGSDLGSIYCRPGNWCGSLTRVLITGQTILPRMARSSTR